MLPHTEALNETELIQRIQQGEKELFEIIIRRYNPYLYKIGRSYNYQHEDTEDLMQDSFVDAYKNLHQFTGQASFKTWLTRIMLNNCYRKKEKKSYKMAASVAINENAIPMFSNTPSSSDSMYQRRELAHTIEQAIANIPFDYRMVFSLREMNGFNIAETAALLQISEANVKVRLNRAKAMLRTEIEKVYSPGQLFEFNLVYCDKIVENVMKRIQEL